MDKGWLIMTGLVVGSLGALAYLWCKFANVDPRFDDDERDEPWW